MSRTHSSNDVGQANQPPPEVAAFSRAVETYCATIEQQPADDHDAFGRRLRGVLADLIAAGYRLPLVEPTTDELLSNSIDHQRWYELFSAVQSTFQEHDLYWSASQAVGPDEPEVTVGSLADDLADIWRDLRGGLDALRSGASWQDVTWEWRFGLEKHWGHHAVEALRALHAATT